MVASTPHAIHIKAHFGSTSNVSGNSDELSKVSDKTRFINSNTLENDAVLSELLDLMHFNNSKWKEASVMIR